MPAVDGAAALEAPFDPDVTKPPICWRSFESAAKSDCAPERFPACKSCDNELKAWLIEDCWEDEEVEDWELSA